MPVPFKIKVTKDILELSKNCGSKELEIEYSLFQLNDFYVEVKYNGGVNAITKITSFSTATKLEPYLQNIKPPVELGANLTLTFFIL
jgi:hypothetical protein